MLEHLILHLGTISVPETAAQLGVGGVALPSGRVAPPYQVVELHNYSREELTKMAAMTMHLLILMEATETGAVVREFPRTLDIPPSIEWKGNFYDPESIARQVIEDDETFRKLYQYILGAVVSSKDGGKVHLAPLADQLALFLDRLEDTFGIAPSSGMTGP